MNEKWGVGMTQHERILDYIDRFGSITPMDAFIDLGITKLATRISEMKQNGIEFEQKLVQSHNRYGERTSYMSYSRKDV